MSKNTDQLERLKNALREYLATCSDEFEKGFRHGLSFAAIFDHVEAGNDIAATEKFIAKLKAEVSKPQITHIYHSDAKKIWQFTPPPK